ncbi:MAG: SpoIIE family protein phosphatase [Bacteroidales bacterium]|nr:SpoIIE family protein phosphatase [Candidatus Hennigimonas equi]
MELKAKKSFSARLSLNIIMLTSILFVATIATASFSSHTILAEEAQTSSERLLESVIKEIEMKLGSVESSVRSISWLVDESVEKQDYMYRIVKNIVASNDHIMGSTIAFAPDFFPGEHYFAPYAFEENGRIYTKQLGTSQYDYFSMEWYKDSAESGKPHWSEPYFDEGGANVMMSTYSYPLKDYAGRTYAIITADISLQWISEMLATIKPYPSSNIILVSAKGECINAQNFDRRQLNFYDWVDSINDDGVRHISDDMAAGKKGLGRFNTSNGLSFAVYNTLSNGWSAAIICLYRDVLVRTSRLLLALVIIGLLGLVILFGVCYALIHKLTRPLTEVTNSALNIAKGNFNTELPEVKTDDEIKMLRDSFDFMQHSLLTYISDLKDSNAKNAKFESDLNVASRIQMGMLPKDFPQVGSVDLHALLHSAKVVGGDLYDFYIKNDILYFAVGDVSGKGLPASLLMAITRAAFRFISSLGMSMAQLMEKLNNSLTEGNETGMFVTFFCGRINLKTGELDYCNAGHNPIVVLPPSGKPYYLAAEPNLALGVFADFKYKDQTLSLEKGTELLIYTDGVTEAERKDKAQYGEDRLLGWMASKSVHNSAKEDCYELMDDLHKFTEGNEQNDDITMMTIKIK